MNGTDAKAIALPAESREEFAGQLQDGETPLAWFEPDLNEELRYARGLVVLTDRRVLRAGKTRRRRLGEVGP